MYTVDDYMMDEPLYTHKCANCGAEIEAWEEPYVKDGRYFCHDECYAEYIYRDDEELTRLFEDVDRIRDFIDHSNWNRFYEWVRS